MALKPKSLSKFNFGEKLIHVHNIGVEFTSFWIRQFKTWNWSISLLILEGNRDKQLDTYGPSYNYAGFFIQVWCILFLFQVSQVGTWILVLALSENLPTLFIFIFIFIFISMWGLVTFVNNKMSHHLFKMTRTYVHMCVYLL